MRLALVTLLALVSLAAPLSAQRGLSPEEQADSDALRALVAQVPLLPVDEIELKPGVALEGISAVTTDRAGNIYVIHRPTDPQGDPVVVLDAGGNFLRSWGRGMYTIPHGIEVDEAGHVWTTDANTSMVYKFSSTGEKLLEIEVGDIPVREGGGGFCSITDVAFSRRGDGHVYVADGYCNGRVVEYDARGQKVREFGSRGDGPGQFNNAHGIAVGPDGNVYVADRENGRLQWFDPSGNLLGIHKYGGQFYNVVFDDRGELWATVHPKGVSLDEESWVVHVDRATGKLLAKVPSRSHQLGVGSDGSLFPATRSESLVVYRPRR